MRSTSLVLLVIAFWSQSGLADGQEQLDSFAAPLVAELINAGLPPNLAEKEAKRLVGGLKECWASEYNDIQSEEQEVETLRLGGETIVTYASPCISAFLLAVSETVPGR